MSLPVLETNFDGLPGPTHNFGGLSFGNVASMEHAFWVSHPKKAALQSLEKMWFLCKLGISQGVFPPHERPHLEILKEIGFKGSVKEIFAKASFSPTLFLASSSSSFMWVANSATVIPSMDAFDQKVHFFPANLLSNFHRTIEVSQTKEILKTIFSNPSYFVHHEPLPFFDEGDANHIRLCKNDQQKGLHLFVYGKSLLTPYDSKLKFPPRQTKEAFESIVRIVNLPIEQAVFAKQHQEAINQGAFHNDVVSTSHQNLFLYHEKAFENSFRVLEELTFKAKILEIEPFHLLMMKEEDISLEEVIKSYFFNSQIVSLPTGKMVMLAPQEVRQSPPLLAWIEKFLLSQKGPIDEIFYMPFNESMQNGGGPACLRLRVLLKEEEKKAVHPGIWLNKDKYQALKQVITESYPEQLHFEHLHNEELYLQNREVLKKIYTILEWPGIPFS